MNLFMITLVEFLFFIHCTCFNKVYYKYYIFLSILQHTYLQNLGLDLDPNQDSHSSRIVNFSMDTSRDPNVPQVVRIPEGPSKNGPKTMREEGDRLTDIIEQAIGCRSIARSSELIPLTSNEKDNLSVLTFDETLDSISCNGKSRSSGLKVRASKPVRLPTHSEVANDAKRKKASSIVEANAPVLRYFFAVILCALVMATTYYNYNTFQSSRTPAQHNNAKALSSKTPKVKSSQQISPLTRVTEFQLPSESIMEYSQEFQKQATSSASNNKDVVGIPESSEDLSLSRPTSTATSISNAIEIPDPFDFNLLSGYKDTWDEHEESDIPLFWHIPKSGGLIVKDILLSCHRMILAQEAISVEGFAEEDVSWILQFY
jgi:hypothetical protein